VEQAAANLKRVTVVARVRASAAGGSGMIPRAMLTALKTFPF
jgi:hypothetical protein